jgi:predicted DNA-binding transcriptional regulator AlpA
MGQGRTFRIVDVAAYLGVSHRRAERMFHEGKFPEPERVDGIGPIWNPATIERWAEREWCGRGDGGNAGTQSRLVLADEIRYLS